MKVVRVPNTQHVDVAVNELKNSVHVLNRNLIKLLQNDVMLSDLYDYVYNQLNILSFDTSKLNRDGYQENDLVWFRDISGQFYLLRCIVADNHTMPKYDPIAQSFADTGWQDEFAYVHILRLGVDKLIASAIEAYLDQHENDPAYHKYGKLSDDKDSVDYIGNKLLRHDLGKNNSQWRPDASRKNVKFPYFTKKLQPTNAILGGFYRQYDDGLLEYDIVFRLGYTGERAMTRVGSKDVIQANDVDFTTHIDVLDNSNLTVSNDRKYFFNGSEGIFYMDQAVRSGRESIIGMTVQKNRNDVSNTYFAKIDFEVPFANTEYAIFTSDVKSQTSNGVSVNNSQNVMTFGKKTQASMTAIYITTPIGLSQSEYNEEGFVSENGGLAANSFHCQVIGKWK